MAKPMSEWNAADWTAYSAKVYEQELTAAAKLLQKYVSIGQVKAIGLREVTAAIEALIEERGLKPLNDGN